MQDTYTAPSTPDIRVVHPVSDQEPVPAGFVEVKTDKGRSFVRPKSGCSSCHGRGAMRVVATNKPRLQNGAKPIGEATCDCVVRALRHYFETMRLRQLTPAPKLSALDAAMRGARIEPEASPPTSESSAPAAATDRADLDRGLLSRITNLRGQASDALAPLEHRLSTLQKRKGEIDHMRDELSYLDGEISRLESQHAELRKPLSALDVEIAGFFSADAEANEVKIRARHHARLVYCSTLDEMDVLASELAVSRHDRSKLAADIETAVVDIAGIDDATRNVEAVRRRWEDQIAPLERRLARRVARRSV